MGVNLGPGFGSFDISGQGALQGATEVGTPPPGQNASTITQSMQEGLATPSSYNATSPLPVLTPPGVTNPLLVNMASGQGFNYSLSQNPEKEALNQQNEFFNESLTANLNLLSEYGVSSESIALAKYAYYHPEDSSVPDDITDLLQRALTQAQSATKEQFKLESFQPPQPDTQLFDNTLKNAVLEEFNNELVEYATEKELSPEDIAKIVYASTHPDDPNVDPDLKQLVADLQGKAFQEVKNQAGLPSAVKMPAPDTKGADGNIQADFSSNFMTLIDLHQPPLSEEQKNSLLYSFHNPDSPPPAGGDPDLAAIYTTLKGQAQKLTADQDGLPEGYDLKPDTTAYNATLNGAFADSVRKLIKSPPQGLVDDAFNQLTPEEQQTLFALTVGNADPDSPAVPENLKAYLKSIREAAIANVTAKYSIPPGKFEPKGEDFQGVELEPPPGYEIANGGLSTADQLIEGFSELIERMPEGPEKVIYANYLASVGAALAQIRSMLYLLQQSDAELNIDLSDSSLQTSQNRIDTGTASNNQSLEDIRDRPKPKGGVLGKMMKFFAKLGPVMSIIMATIVLGPAGGILMALDMKLGIISKMMNGVANAIGKIAEACGASPKAVQAIKSITKCVMLAAMFMAMGPAAGAAFMFLGPTIIQSSGVLEDTVAIFVNNPQQAQQIAMYVGMAIAGVMAVGMMLVPIPGPQLAGILAGAASVLTTVATSVARISTLLADALMLIVKGIKEVGNFIESFTSVMSFTGRVISKAIGEALEPLTSLLPGTAQVAVRAPDAVVQAAGTLDDIGTSIINGLKNFGSNMIDQTVDRMTSFTGIAETVQVAGSIEQGVFQLKMAGYLKKLANSKEKQAIMEAMISMLTEILKNLRKVMDNIFKNLSGISEQINTINNTVGLLYKDASDTQSRLHNVQG